jgi:IS30 family transposase
MQLVKMSCMKKKRSFVHLKIFDRDRMEALLLSGHNQSEVAKILKVDKSTISREKQRKRTDGKYDAGVAEHKALVRRENSKYQGMKIETHPELRKFVISELKKYQSPDCIAGRMKKEDWPVRVSGDAIYRWLRSVYGARYCRYLCTKRHNKKKQTHTPKRRIIPNMASIHSMPSDPGWITEGDTFGSPRKTSKTNGVLVVWRETKLLKGDLVKSLRPMHTTKVMRKIHIENRNDAMILDQGGENREHEKFGVQTYFCDPASPRQKPLIESSIGLCRRWFWPKGTNLKLVSKEEFQEKLEILNNKYRKSLRYRSANEVSREYGILK